jgi:uroporphyrinogen decarboxylase
MIADSNFLRACRGERTQRIPVWLMRQAGRYLPEYRALREKHELLEMIRTPELAARVTLQPLERFRLDAAIIFSDILPPLQGMGLDLSFIPGKGPVIQNPLRRPYDIDRLGTPPAAETMKATLEAIGIATRELAGRHVPLIGFAGAPFTLASYAIEGGGSRNYAATKALMYQEPSAWKRLMTKLVTVQADYLLRQVDAGVNALQVFDSFVGLALGPDDYQRYVAPYNRNLFRALTQSGVPVIHYSGGTGAYLELVAETGGDVMGIDWRTSLGDARRRLGLAMPVQGNMDPVALCASWRELRAHIDAVLADAGDSPGYIFNLGQGVLPGTPIENVTRLVDYVQSQPGDRL